MGEKGEERKRNKRGKMRFKGGKKIYGSDKKERKTNQTRKKETRREKMSLHGLVSVSIAAIFPLTGPHICFSHSSHTLRSLKVQLN